VYLYELATADGQFDSLIVYCQILRCQLLKGLDFVLDDIGTFILLKAI
jgi:hypothetical protein